MIENEFIPYQESLELKELGFNEPCFGYYYTLNGKNWVFADKHKYYQLDEEINIGPKFSLLVPTYSQAFRWFRDKGFLISFSSHDKDTYEFYIKWISTKSILSNEYKTYEEAELECLRQLIKITKQSLYSIPIYENNIKTEHTVDGITGDEKYFKLLEYGDGKNLPNMINLTLRNNHTKTTLEK